MSRRWRIVLVGGLLLVGLVVGTWVLYWAISPQTPAERSDFTRTVVLIVAVLALAYGLYLLWRTRTENRTAQQEDAKAREERERVTRYTQAVSQLGADKREVRLGGIYALEQIAEESNSLYQQSIEVLAAYIRGNAPWRPQQPANNASDNHAAPPPSGGPRARPRSRPPVGASATVSAAQPNEEIQIALNVLRHRRLHAPDGESFRIDLSRTDLRGVEIAGIHLEGADLHGANLSHANLAGAHLGHAHLAGAILAGAYLVKANLEGADLRDASLRGADLTVATLTDAHLERADLAGASLEDANLLDAQLEGARLAKANLAGADLGGASMQRVELAGAQLGNAHLRGADLRDTTLDAAALSSVRGLTWEQAEHATIRDGDRIVWQEGVGNREELMRLLPDDVVVPNAPPSAAMPEADMDRLVQQNERPPSV
jgi:hypothetical protein